MSRHDSTLLAASGDVLAIVDNVVDPAAFLVCRRALARLGSLEAIRAPERFSGLTPDGIPMHATRCDVAALGEGFVLLWQQSLDAGMKDVSTFAQRIERDGSPKGERLTLDEHASSPWLGSAASDGERVAVALRDHKLAFITEHDLVLGSFESSAAASFDSTVSLTVAHDGYLARAGSQLWLLDSDGRAHSEPIALRYAAFAAALGPGYLTLDREQYLVATSFDAALRGKSEPLGLSTDPSAYARALLAGASEQVTYVAYRDESGPKLATLGCSDRSPGPLGSYACPEQAAPAPLGDGCDEEVCHVILRFDYQTLELRRWASAGGPKQPVTSERALATAQENIKANAPYSRSVSLEGPNAGLYFAYASPRDFGAFALIGADSGVIAAAGSISWGANGRYWAPTSWREYADIACGDTAAEPAQTFIGKNECLSREGKPHADINAALDTALRTNIAAGVAARGPFSAYAFLYTPITGPCDPLRAEYVVVLSQTRSL